MELKVTAGHFIEHDVHIFIMILTIAEYRNSVVIVGSDGFMEDFDLRTYSLL